MPGWATTRNPAEGHRKFSGAVSLFLAMQMIIQRLQLAAGGLERVAQCYVDILMGVVFFMFMVHQHLMTRDGDVQVHMEDPALLVVVVGRLNDDLAPHDAVVKFLQPGHLLANVNFDGRRRLHVPEGNLKGFVHDGHLSFCAIFATKMINLRAKKWLKEKSVWEWFGLAAGPNRPPTCALEHQARGFSGFARLIEESQHVVVAHGSRLFIPSANRPGVFDPFGADYVIVGTVQGVQGGFGPHGNGQNQAHR